MSATVVESLERFRGDMFGFHLTPEGMTLHVGQKCFDQLVLELHRFNFESARVRPIPPLDPAQIVFYDDFVVKP